MSANPHVRNRPVTLYRSRDGELHLGCTACGAAFSPGANVYTDFDYPEACLCRKCKDRMELQGNDPVRFQYAGVVMDPETYFDSNGHQHGRCGVCHAWFTNIPDRPVYVDLDDPGVCLCSGCLGGRRTSNLRAAVPLTPATASPPPAPAPTSRSL